MKQSNPKVSALMPVYNGGVYLQEAVESILNQTFEDFEFLIIDDGSTDDSWQQLQTYANRDRRIRLFQNEQNCGLIKTLNRGISLVNGKYIARMDADDIAMPERFQQQVTYLDLHNQIGVLGTAYIRIYSDGRKILRQPPQSDTAIRWRLLFGNVWAHDTVMFRKELIELERPFYHSYLYVEDYELWIRLLKHVHGATLTAPLMQIRMHMDSGISATNQAYQEHMVKKISCQQIGTVVQGKFTKLQIEEIRALVLPKRIQGKDIDACEIMLTLFDTFKQLPVTNNGILYQIRRQWLIRVLTVCEFAHLNRTDRAKLLTQIWRYDPGVFLMFFVFHLPKIMVRQLMQMQYRGA